MSIASNITALVNSLITAINARSTTGASDYQMWLAQGNTGTLDDYRQAMLGADENFAATFSGALGPYPTSGTASEAQAGITQFATQAETFAATSAVKAVSPLQLAAYNQYAGGVRVTGLAGLLALMQSTTLKPGVGTIIHVAADAVYYGILHYGSVWRVTTNGKAEPLNNVPILLDNTSSMGNLGFNYSNASGALWNRWLNFDNRNTAVLTASANGIRQEYRWDPTNQTTGAFRLWPGLDTYTQIEYTGGGDTPMANNGYVIMSFDTIVFDGLYMDYLGTSGGSPKGQFRINYTGRYDLQFRWAATNDDVNTDYNQTIFNISQNRDHFQGLFRVRADMANTLTALGRQFNNGDVIQAAVFKGSANSNWIRRGNNDATVLNSNRPMLYVRYTGWN